MVSDRMVSDRGFVTMDIVSTSFAHDFFKVSQRPLRVAPVTFNSDSAAPPCIKLVFSDFIGGNVLGDNELYNMFMQGGFIMVFIFFLSKSVKLGSVQGG